jgi:ADP-ribose pyrophosphatase
MTKPPRPSASEAEAARKAPYPGDSARGEIALLAPHRVLQTPYVEAFNDRVRFPNGAEGECFRWYWTAPYGVIALPYLADGSVVLIEQFRHNDRAWRLEAPRGFGQADETPEQAACREVSEETGLTVQAVQQLRSIGHAAYRVHLFLVAVSSTPDHSTESDSAEAIAGCHHLPASSVAALLDDPRIHDAETLLLLSQFMRRALPR